jgi:hypothetical protein
MWRTTWGVTPTAYLLASGAPWEAAMHLSKSAPGVGLQDTCSTSLTPVGSEPTATS